MEIREILFILVVFASNIIEAITGFAGTLLAMPFSMVLIGLNDSKVILNVIALVIGISTGVKYVKYTNKKELIKIIAFMLIGMLIGMQLLGILPERIIMFIYGIVVLAVAINGLFNKKEFQLSKTVGIIVLVLAGIIHGMYLSGGSLLVIYAVSMFNNKDEFRATLASVWIALNGYLITRDVIIGNFTTYNLTLILILLIPLVIAITLGYKIQKVIEQKHFIRLTYVLLLISGTMLILH